LRRRRLHGLDFVSHVWGGQGLRVPFRLMSGLLKAGGPGDSEQTQKALAGRLGSIGNWRLGIGAPGIGSRVLA